MVVGGGGRDVKCVILLITHFTNPNPTFNTQIIIRSIKSLSIKPDQYNFTVWEKCYLSKITLKVQPIICNQENSRRSQTCTNEKKKGNITMNRSRLLISDSDHFYI